MHNFIAYVSIFIDPSPNLHHSAPMIISTERIETLMPFRKNSFHTPSSIFFFPAIKNFQASGEKTVPILLERGFCPARKKENA